MKYSYFYKEKYEDLNNLKIKSQIKERKYDILISAYNRSERIDYIQKHLNYTKLHWLILPEYNFANTEIESLNGEIFNYSKDSDFNESDIINDYFRNSKISFELSNVVIDITGFLRPYIIYLIRLLKEKGTKKIDFIYSEPKSYQDKENTKFSSNHLQVREIKGCLGSHNPETYNDVLIFGSGYDYERIKLIGNEKKEARKIQIFGFPSLQADMFQQNILKAYKAENDSTSGEFDLDSEDIILAPANDPFITAELISDFIKKEKKKKKITNIYLSPLSTKAQALGMGLFYIFECIDEPVSILFPFCKTYSPKTSLGISKFWIYTIEL